jgi:hypothetical protein
MSISDPGLEPAELFASAAVGEATTDWGADPGTPIAQFEEVLAVWATAR